MESFAERLKFILAGRLKHRWGEAMGIPKGVVTTMFRDVVPRASTLAAIQHAENARVDWLLTGHGAPFLVETYPRSGDELRRLAQGLHDEPQAWTVAVVHDGAAAAAVLTQPGGFENDDVAIKHTIVEVLAGPASGPELAECARHAPHAHLRYLRIDPEQLAALCAGQMGTWALLGDDKHPGLLVSARAEALPDEPARLVADAPPDYAHEREQRLLARCRALSARRQAALLELLGEDEDP